MHHFFHQERNKKERKEEKKETKHPSLTYTYNRKETTTKKKGKDLFAFKTPHPPKHTNINQRK